MRFAKRRGMSELIATLMLLGITTVGSVFLASVVYGSGFTNLPNAGSDLQPSYSIKLTGYDTRDSTNLLGISSVDNKFDKKLCTVSCQGFADNIPQDANAGTEFIMLQIRNISPETMYLRGIQINGITHTWDDQTSGKTLDASANDFTGKYPHNGKFSIVSTSDVIQKTENIVSSDEEVRLVIKTSKDLNSDISLTKPIQIHINFGGIRASEHVILSGEIR